MAAETTYHCDCYENTEQDGQTEVLPRELLVRWRPDVGPVGAGRCYFARHPASPETEHDTELEDSKKERKKERRRTMKNQRERKRNENMKGRTEERKSVSLSLFS